VSGLERVAPLTAQLRGTAKKQNKASRTSCRFMKPARCSKGQAPMITDFPLDFASFSKTWKPNQFLALPAGFAARQKADMDSPVVTASADAVRAAWLRVIAGEARTGKVREAGGQIEVVQRTPLLGFPDTITALPVDLGDGRASICVFSRSRFGIRDFAVNETRVRRWLAALTAQLAAG
jgi:uncharacterized protein (DUF1499 family)